VAAKRLERLGVSAYSWKTLTQTVRSRRGMEDRTKLVKRFTV
jgi:hypothetical protein